MRTAAFSDLQIINAVNELKANSQKVSAYTVIRLLGGGSVPYTSKALIRLARSGVIELESIADEDDEILQAIKQLLDRNRAEASVNAQKEYQVFKTRLESAIEDLRDKNKTFESEKKSLENQLRSALTEIDSLQKKCSDQQEIVTALTISKNRLEDQLTNSSLTLKKTEEQSESYRKMLNDAHDTHQAERRELLDRLNAISVNSQNSIQSSQNAEQSMRLQLAQAMKDGLAHTNTISKLRDDLRTLDGGRSLLKKYGSWEKISSLCKQSTPKK